MQQQFRVLKNRCSELSLSWPTMTAKERQGAVLIRTDLILIGASHLGNIARHVNQERWNVVNLTRPGWRVTSDNVKDLVAEVTSMAASMNIDNATVILQLLDNSVYMVRGPGGGGDKTPR
jgi:hypothetical protein